MIDFPFPALQVTTNDIGDAKSSPARSWLDVKHLAGDRSQFTSDPARFHLRGENKSLHLLLLCPDARPDVP
jgi:hypothetical protein